MIKRLIFCFFASLLTLLLLGSSSVSAITAQPLPPVLPASPLLITAYRTSTGQLDYAQLYNSSSDLVALEGWQVETTASNSSTDVVTPITLHGWLPSKQYMILSRSGVVDAADSSFASAAAAPGFAVTKLQLLPPSAYAPYVVSGGLFVSGTRYDLSKSSAGNYTTTSKFVATTEVTPLYGGGLYAYAETSPLRIVEVLANPRDCGPLDGDLACSNYVKIYNTSTQTIELSDYRLRIGYANDSVSITNTVHITGQIAPGGYRTIATRDDSDPLEITNTGGNVWLEDVQGIKTYAETAITYADASDTKGLSWAQDADGVWKWGMPTPDALNAFPAPGSGSVTATAASSLVPCKEGQERSLETNRCRTVVAADSLAPCKDGQERSPETNRCRAAAAVASATLAPCAADQERNPATNRCRKIAAAESSLTPCKPGQERNPDTNRCRNASSADVPAAAFKPETINEGNKAFTGWMALGGVGAVAAGRAGWQWRQELIDGIRKVAGFFISAGK